MDDPVSVDSVAARKLFARLALQVCTAAHGASLAEVHDEEVNGRDKGAALGEVCEPGERFDAAPLLKARGK